MAKMFEFITKVWNPLGGECLHNCSYGWCKKLIKQYGMQKYTGKARLFDKELLKSFSKDDFVFVCDMCDLFGEWVPSDLIRTIVSFANASPAQFLFLTKNPKRYKEFAFAFNCVLGATIECDMNFKVNSEAPTPYSRLDEMKHLKHSRKMVSVEPIMNYTEDFLYELLDIKPEFIAVGYDNYNNGLPEPYLAKTMGLIMCLENNGIKVYRKTLREKFILSGENKQK
jgi:protein gp37